MNDTNAFERLIGDVAREAMGPTRPLDVEAVIRSVALGTPAPEAPTTTHIAGPVPPAKLERRLSVFSAVKLVAAVTIISVSGTLLISGALQPGPVADPVPASVEASGAPLVEPTVPGWVTGIADGHEVVGSQGRKWLEGRTTYPQEVVRAEQMSPDSRFAGSLTITYNLHELGLGDALSGGAVGGGALTAGTIRLENDGGTWVGDFTGLREPDDPWSHRMQVLLEGEGGYDGMRALLAYEGFMGEGFGYSGSQSVEGFVFEGPMPEVPTE